MVLVTGGSGFLGQHLVRYLSAQGVAVRAMYHQHPPTGELSTLPHVTWVGGDLQDVYTVEEVMQGMTDVYHCAAIVSFDPKQRDELLHFNPSTTANIVDQALDQGIRKLVYISSVAALGRTGVPGKEITEDDEWEEKSKYNSAYGTSKYMAEMEVWRGIGEGLNAAIVNPGIILGQTTGRDLSAQLMKMVYREFPFYSSGSTSWVDADDVVKAAVMLMDSDIHSERFIISAGNFPYRDIFGYMAAALDKRAPRIATTPLMAGIAWRLSKLASVLLGKKTFITKETALNANTRSDYSNTKLLKVFPAFAYTPIDATIAHMARSFKASIKK